MTKPSTINHQLSTINRLLSTVYEDENMLVVNKPSGMLTHPTTVERGGSVAELILAKYGALSDVNGEMRPGILHRLDRNTSGLLMVAKNNEAHEFLSQQIKDRTVVKKYRAIVKGNFNEDEFEINLPVGRHPKRPEKMAVGGKNSKESITRVKVLERFKEASYLELTLVTGRTHQIRVHLSHLGHPIYNDTMYGSGRGKCKTEEQVLQSFYLRFTKPFGDEIIELEIEPDEKVSKILRYFKNKA
jgi:23S rRNA pseudouridine1911/1915/1917 synthase